MSRAITFANVGLQLGGRVIYDDLSFSIEAQQLACLVGPSGCGKSTLLRVIGGLLPVQSGHVDVFGDTPSKAWPLLAYVFQAPRLLPWKDALDNAAFGLEMRRPKMSKSARRDRAAAELERVGLAQDRHKMPASLSGGERQRVAIARAMALDPDVILMDEPFSALDPTTRRRLRRQLIELWQETRKTIVFVTHDLEETLELATQVIALSAKPARVEETFAIAVDHPRNLSVDPDIEVARNVLLRRFHDPEPPTRSSPA